MRLLRTAPIIAEESVAIASKVADGIRHTPVRSVNKMVDEVYALAELAPASSSPKSPDRVLRQGPFSRSADEFADELFSTLKNGSSTTKSGILLEVEKGLNAVRERKFPYVPAVTVRSSDATSIAHGSASRNQINIGLDVERVAGEVAVAKSDKPLPTSALATAVSHEFVHVEQFALRWWRKADQLEVGSRPLPSQMRSLLQADASNKDFVEHVLRFRDGRQLTPIQATRADRLAESYMQSKAHAPLFQHLFDENQKAQFIVRGPKPATVAEFAMFHDRVLSSPIPSKMTSVVVEKGLISPLPKEESGRVLFEAFEKYATSAFARYVRDGYKPYRNTFHEREAHAFGNNVATHYELREALRRLY